ncbi:MAG: hypothetical protein P4L40_12270 [Terracidiphilus sp.]|nr:hypothetical protein [Terracidiphilus sp.]
MCACVFHVACVCLMFSAPGPALAAPAHTSQSAPDSHTLSAATLAASPEQGAAYPAGYTATATPTIPAIAAPGRYSTQGYPQQEQGWGYSGGYRTPQGYGYPLPGCVLLRLCECVVCEVASSVCLCSWSPVFVAARDVFVDGRAHVSMVAICV